MKELDPYRPLLKKINDHNYDAYFVGGCVRNVLLKRRIDDIDIATNAPIEVILEIFKDKTMDQQGMAFHSIGIIYKRKPVTITEFRIEGEYVKHRYPSTISFTDDVRVDANRRDFTMNALYVNDKNEIIDFFGGLTHIKERKLVSVKNADRSMSEDALRILRALRFVVVYNLKMDDELEDAIESHSSLIHRLSRHSLNMEVEKLQKQATSEQQTNYYKLLMKYDIKM